MLEQLELSDLHLSYKEDRYQLRSIFQITSAFN